MIEGITDLLNISAAIVSQVGPQNPADAVLRAELKSHRKLSPGSSRAISRAVFAYYRWWKWLGGPPIPQQLIRAIEQSGAKLRTLATHEATLEDLFVSLTGRELRDA